MNNGHRSLRFCQWTDIVGHVIFVACHIACYAERCISYDRCCLTVCLTHSSYDHAPVDFGAFWTSQNTCGNNNNCLTSKQVNWQLCIHVCSLFKSDLPSKRNTIRPYCKTVPPHGWGMGQDRSRAQRRRDRANCCADDKLNIVGL